MPSRSKFLIAASATAFAIAGASVYWFALRPASGDSRLNALVRERPTVPVVFTSRSEPASFQAAAPDGEDFTYPGKRLWQAREGRLRVLLPNGAVVELTWNKSLPDGGTLIDVMSPSISIDGRTVLFAGRKGGDDPGHFRLYEVGLDGSDLKAVTGGPNDEGAVAAPPMRFRSDGSTIPDDERRRIDYDDVDPVEIRAEPREILFASSRTPDLGRDHARRSTTLWILHADGRKAPATANRNNDRWPFLMADGYAAFSLWSRNREVITADERDVRPFDPALASASPPTDAWLGAFVRISSSGHFGMLIKPNVPVWRPRPLFDGRIAFMTRFGPADAASPLCVAVAESGLIASAPSSAIGSLPRQKGVPLDRSPDLDAEGRPLWTATPSPCPPNAMLVSAASLDPGQTSPAPGRYGIYLANESVQDLRLLFDDPDFVDSEPVAAYPRKVTLPPPTSAAPAVAILELKLAGDKPYRGPAGTLMATSISAAMMNDLPGQTTDAGESPIFGPPPSGAIDHLKIYASRRDRFDDPVKPRVPGKWELLMELQSKGNFVGTLPTDCPTVLAGFGADGRVLRWTTPAKDSAGRRASFYAIAGDHYSLTAPGGKHFCVGCHPGHSGIGPGQHKHAERIAD